ncbi:MAG: 4-hydroxy-tetrahydrodipicolinate synthase [Victivallales bacterium]|jgi:4-hydroxy-tetrahydrodipicolinate synthase|nr:4-hydroxy-tetrahydrodipicolinate synthase [Victivallales bacterium]
MMNFKGVYTALVTPFRDGKVDYDALKILVELQIAGKVSGIVPVGTTGESPTLSPEEHLKVIETVVQVSAGRCQVIAGTGANSTSEAVYLTKEAKALGADATLQVTPYYNKPTQEGLYRHFSTVADQVGLPVVLYNVPGRSGVPIAESTVSRLAKNPLIGAVKEAAGSVDRVSAILDLCDITVLSGDDSLTLPMMAVGAKGIISVSSNLIPGEMSEMVELALAGNFAEAYEFHRKYYPLFRDQFIETNPIPIKAAMAMAGLLAEEYRLPLCELAQGNREKLAATLKRCGII